MGRRPPTQERCRASIRFTMSGRCAGPSGKKIDAMQVKETVADGLKHEFQISVPAADIEAKVDARLVDMKDKVRLNGFRPAKVPVGHLKRLYRRPVPPQPIQPTIPPTNPALS